MLNFNLDLESCVGSNNLVLSNSIRSLVICTKISFFSNVRFSLGWMQYIFLTLIGMTFYLFRLNSAWSGLIHVSFFPPSKRKSSILFEHKNTFKITHTFIFLHKRFLHKYNCGVFNLVPFKMFHNLINADIQFLKGQSQSFHPCLTHFFSFFLLSEHILCKESIVIVKKFDFEIFTYFIQFQVSWIYLYYYGDICMQVYMCMWMNTILTKRCTRLNSNLVCMLLVTVGRTLIILVNIA